MIFDARHGVGGDHGVDDGFFDGLDSSREDRFDQIVGKHLDADDVIGGFGIGISGGESDEDIAGAVARNAAVATETEGNAARETLELMRDERNVGGDDDDDGATLGDVGWNGGGCVVAWNFTADGNAA